MKKSTQKDYCIREPGPKNNNCQECSLSSYNRDCRNNPIPTHEEIVDEVREYLDTGIIRK